MRKKLENCTLEEIQAEKERAEKELRFREDQVKIMEHNVKKLTRQERTHRLCTRAGMLESFLKTPELLTNDQIMELLKVAFAQEEVQQMLDQMIEEALIQIPF